MTRPLETLGLPISTTKAEVQERWRQLRSVHHPDKGGDADTFHKYKQAYDEAMVLLSQPQACDTCKGSGSIKRARGIHTIDMDCRDCGGTGQKGE